MQNKLLPCPCCGSEIKGGVRLTGYMMMNKTYIECDACGLKMESKYSIDESMSQTHLKAIGEDLINKWNTRKPMERIVAELECLYKYNSEQATLYHDMEKQDAHTREMKDLYIDRANCYGVAIRTVKGGVDNE